MKRFLIFIATILLCLNVDAQCTKIVKYDAIFDTTTVTEVVSEAYTEKQIVEYGRFEYKRTWITLKEGYVDYVPCYSNGVCTGYKPKLVQPIKECITAKIWIEPVYKLVHHPAVTREIDIVTKIKDAEIKTVTIDCK